jgi:CheY-like chemotaxis protein
VRGEPPSGNGEHVLFVDDEPMLREVGSLRLQDVGYAVTLAEDGPRALELFEAQSGRFDLVVTDYTMPRMSGLQLAARIHGIRPDLPIILVSGVAENLDDASTRAAGVRRVLSKPHTLFELAAVLRDVLAPV